ncbi:hypothetical protein FQR65_LT18553 [Abscondita terminalis]|nr:hypothetical protein FQR65_LT18553 [Abscondita terminalis]
MSISSFFQIEDDVIEAQIQKLEQTKQDNKKTNPNANPMKEEITFDDFGKIDLRTATILEAEKVEKADKLLKFKVDTGVDIRTVVSGVAESFNPEELIGKQVMILLNLAPEKSRWVLNSQEKLSDQELKKYIAPESRFTPEAVQMALEILKERGLQFSNQEETLVQKIVQDKKEAEK